MSVMACFESDIPNIGKWNANTGFNVCISWMCSAVGWLLSRILTGWTGAEVSKVEKDGVSLLEFMNVGRDGMS